MYPRVVEGITVADVETLLYTDVGDWAQAQEVDVDDSV